MKKEEQKKTVIQLDEAANIIKVFTESWTIARSLKKAGYQPVKKNGGWLVEIPQPEIS